jgi:hypothetical protein
MIQSQENEPQCSGRTWSNMLWPAIMTSPRAAIHRIGSHTSPARAIIDQPSAQKTSALVYP